MPESAPTQTISRNEPRHQAAGRLFAVLTGTLILTLSSYVSIPMPPVPATLQTLAIVLVGASMGWRLGGITVVAWLAEAAAGLPVLAHGTGGLAAFFGPTGGYLLAFPVLGIAAGLIVARGWNGSRPLRAFLAITAALAFTLFAGTAWLAAFVGPTKAFWIGFAPFIPVEILKAALAVTTLAGWRSIMQRLRPGG